MRCIMSNDLCDAQDCLLVEESYIRAGNPYTHGRSGTPRYLPNQIKSRDCGG